MATKQFLSYSLSATGTMPPANDVELEFHFEYGIQGFGEVRSKWRREVVTWDRAGESFATAYTRARNQAVAWLEREDESPTGTVVHTVVDAT